MLYAWVLQVKVALCQLHVTADKEQNMATAKSAIEVIFKLWVHIVKIPTLYISQAFTEQQGCRACSGSSTPMQGWQQQHHKAVS